MHSKSFEGKVRDDGASSRFHISGFFDKTNDFKAPWRITTKRYCAKIKITTVGDTYRAVDVGRYVYHALI
jgi:hypothetical protein